MKKNNPQKIKLSKYEEDLLNTIENGSFTNQLTKGLSDDLVKSAAYTLSKKKSISLRLPENDLLMIRNKAAYLGIPYQTLITSIVHLYANKKVEKEKV
jgi:predicted DNA binding CopG/RHH family protein